MTRSVDDGEIREIVRRLARPNSSGGSVVERAALLAEGVDVAAVEAWIVDHDGLPEEAATKPSGGGGLYGARFEESNSSVRPPRRYVLPPGATD